MKIWNSIRNFLSKKDNLLSVLTILIALILLFVDLFTDFITIESMFTLIVVILTLLSLDNIIERETRFYELKSSLGRSIDGLKDMIENTTEPFLKWFRDLPDMRSYSDGAKELFFVGATCNTLLTIETNLLEEWVKKGNSLKFLILDPEGNWLKDVVLPVNNYDYNTFKNEINQALKKIADLKILPNSKVEVRLSNLSPTLGVCIKDGGEYLNNFSQIAVHLYLPNEGLGRRPCFILSKAKDGKFFDIFYERYYEQLWNSSKPY